MSIYHYTNIGALLSIIANQEIWLTNIGYMNDASELIGYFKHIENDWAEGVVDRKLAAKNLPDEVKQNLKSGFIAEHTPSDILINAELYVMSFCKKENNLLSQWRGYTDGNSGCCIEFDENKLNELCRDNGEKGNCDGGIIADCIYDRKEILKELNRLKTGLLSKDKGEASEALKKCIQLCCFAKHEDFTDEHEKRLLVSSEWLGGRNTFFRENSGAIVPFIKLSITLDVIKSVNLGPSRNQQLNFNGLKMLFKKYDAEHVKISTSDTPIR